MLRRIVLAGAILPLAASVASATIIYQNTGSGVNPSNASLTAEGIYTLPDNSLQSGLFLDDVIAAPGSIAGAPPYQINQVDIGYYNQAPTPVTFDILMQFYANVNYSNSGALATNPIGGVFRISNVTVAGNDGIGVDGAGETGLVALTGSLPVSTTGSFGIEYQFVTPGSSFGPANQSPSMIPLAITAAPTIGSSVNYVGFDYNQNGTIAGPSDEEAVDNVNTGNLYLEVGATVPEPASLSLVAGSLLLLSRRRANATASGR